MANPQVIRSIYRRVMFWVFRRLPGRLFLLSSLYTFYFQFLSAHCGVFQPPPTDNCYFGKLVNRLGDGVNSSR